MCITADGDCSHEIKRHLLLGKKAMKNLDSVLKNRHITLPTKVYIVRDKAEKLSETRILSKTPRSQLKCFV